MKAKREGLEDTQTHTHTCTHVHAHTHPSAHVRALPLHLPDSSGSSLIYSKVPKLTVKVGVKRFFWALRRNNSNPNPEHELFCLY